MCVCVCECMLFPYYSANDLCMYVYLKTTFILDKNIDFFFLFVYVLTVDIVPEKKYNNM